MTIELRFQLFPCYFNLSTIVRSINYTKSRSFKVKKEGIALIVIPTSGAPNVLVPAWAHYQAGCVHHYLPPSLSSCYQSSHLYQNKALNLNPSRSSNPAASTCRRALLTSTKMTALSTLLSRFVCWRNPVWFCTITGLQTQKMFRIEA